MSVESQSCPKCGAAVHFKKNQKEVVCTYCGATVVKSISTTEGAVSLEKEIEVEKISQKMFERTQRLAMMNLWVTAKILTAQKTDIFKNKLSGKTMLMKFTVEVQPDNQAPYNAETDDFVRLIYVDEYKPGAILDVFYDPKDHSQVSVAGLHGVKNSSVFEMMKPYDDQIQKGFEGIRKADEEMRKADDDAEEDDEELEDTGTPPGKASTPAWGNPHARGTMPVPAQFDPVTNLGAPTAVYRNQGKMLIAIGGTKPKELVLYHDGLAYHTGGREIYTWRWSDVAAILSKVHRYSNEYTLIKSNGEKLILDDALGFKDFNEKIKPIKHAVYTLLYPPLEQHYNAEQVVTFGPVTVHRTKGLQMGDKSYAWADIIDVKVEYGRLKVTTSDDHKHETRTSEIPNVELLCRLIGVKPDSIDLCEI